MLHSTVRQIRRSWLAALLIISLPLTAAAATPKTVEFLIGSKVYVQLDAKTKFIIEKKTGRIGELQMGPVTRKLRFVPVNVSIKTTQLKRELTALNKSIQRLANGQSGTDAFMRAVTRQSAVKTSLNQLTATKTLAAKVSRKPTGSTRGAPCTNAHVTISLTGLGVNGRYTRGSGPIEALLSGDTQCVSEVDFITYNWPDGMMEGSASDTSTPYIYNQAAIATVADGDVEWQVYARNAYGQFIGAVSLNGAILPAIVSSSSASSVLSSAASSSSSSSISSVSSSVSSVQSSVQSSAQSSAQNSSQSSSNGTNTNDGWTVLNLSADSQQVYVSSTIGNDAYTGLCPSVQANNCGPKRTISAGYALVRNGSADWLLLRRSDAFNEGFPKFVKSGRSATEPLVFTAYGTGDRPQLNTGIDRCIYTSGGGGYPATQPVSHIRIVSINCHASGRDPVMTPSIIATPENAGGTQGLVLYTPADDWVVEDSVFQYYGFNIVLEGLDGMITNFRLRRNQILDAWSTVFHSSGIYTANVNGVLIEENIVDHNGWNEAIPAAIRDIFNHNLYLQYDSADQSRQFNITVLNNIITRGASHGVQHRPGGRIEGNLFAQNAIAGFTGRADGVVKDNVILESNNIDAANPRGWGFEVYQAPLNVIEGNIIAHQIEGQDVPGLNIILNNSAPNAANQLRVRNNIIYRWAHNPSADLFIDTSTFNVLENSGNIFGPNIASRFPDPERSIRSYSATQGLASTDSAFYGAVRAQSKSAGANDRGWRAAFTTQSINNYIRAGFGVGAVSSSSAASSSAASSSVSSSSVASSSLSSSSSSVASSISSSSSSSSISSQSSSSSSSSSSQNSSGWSNFPLAADARAVYVDNSVSCSDANPGTSPSAPKCTVAGGYAELRDGYPDHLRVKRGTTYTEFQHDAIYMSKSGRSHAEPLVIEAYGDESLPRPILDTGSYDGGTFARNSRSYLAHIAIMNFEIRPDANGNGSGIGLIAGGAGTLNGISADDILFEDLYIHGYGFNMVLQSAEDGAFLSNITVRRCTIVNALGGGHSSGVFTSGIVGTFLMEENVLDHNGWSEDGNPDHAPNVFNHNVYQSIVNTTRPMNYIFRGNISARASSHGIQMRSGGVAQDNLMLANSLDILCGAEALRFPCDVQRNVALEAKDIDPAQGRGQQIDIANVSNGVVAYNLLAHNFGHQPHSFWFGAVTSKGGTAVENLDVHHNVAFNAGQVEFEGPAVNVRFHDNQIQDTSTSRLLMFYYQGPATSAVSSSNNRFFTPITNPTYFDSGYRSLPQWRTSVGDTTSTSQQIVYPNPAVSIGNYSTFVGGAGTLDDFMTKAKQNRRGAFNSAYTAAAANAWLRSQFGMP